MASRAGCRLTACARFGERDPGLVRRAPSAVPLDPRWPLPHCCSSPWLAPGSSAGSGATRRPPSRLSDPCSPPPSERSGPVRRLTWTRRQRRSGSSSRAIPGHGSAPRPGISLARSSSGGASGIAAIAAFGEASRRDRGSIGALSRLGLGYAHEAKGDAARALEIYQQALGGIGPKDFLYGDLLLAKARAQEQSKDSSAAIATYKQYLKDLPTSASSSGRSNPASVARQRRLSLPQSPSRRVRASTRRRHRTRFAADARRSVLSRATSPA